MSSLTPSVNNNYVIVSTLNFKEHSYDVLCGLKQTRFELRFIDAFLLNISKLGAQADMPLWVSMMQV